jgi:hypothetical protein
MRALFGTAGDADRATAGQAGELPDHAAHRTGGRRHHDGLARLGSDDLVQSVPGRHPGHADRAQVGGQRHALRVDNVQAATVANRQLLPAEIAGHAVARLEARVAGLDHRARGAPAHGFVERLRLHVAAPLVHAAAHVRIERQPLVAHQQFTVLQRRRFHRLEAEVVRRDPALRATGEDDAA